MFEYILYHKNFYSEIINSIVNNLEKSDYIENRKIKIHNIEYNSVLEAFLNNMEFDSSVIYNICKDVNKDCLLRKQLITVGDMIYNSVFEFAINNLDFGKELGFRAGLGYTNFNTECFDVIVKTTGIEKVEQNKIEDIRKNKGFVEYRFDDKNKFIDFKYYKIEEKREKDTIKNDIALSNNESLNKCNNIKVLKNILNELRYVYNDEINTNFKNNVDVDIVKEDIIKKKKTIYNICKRIVNVVETSKLNNKDQICEKFSKMKQTWNEFENEINKDQITNLENLEKEFINAFENKDLTIY